MFERAVSAQLLSHHEGTLTDERMSGAAVNIPPGEPLCGVLQQQTVLDTADIVGLTSMPVLVQSQFTHRPGTSGV